MPNKYLLNKRINKGRLLLCLKVSQLIFRKITQKNVGGTNYIGGQGEVPKNQKLKIVYLSLTMEKSIGYLTRDAEFCVRKFSGLEKTYLNDFSFTFSSPEFRGKLLKLEGSNYS